MTFIFSLLHKCYFIINIKHYIIEYIELYLDLHRLTYTCIALRRDENILAILGRMLMQL